MRQFVRAIMGRIDRVLQAICRFFPKTLQDLIERYHRMLTYGFMGVINTAVDFAIFTVVYNLLKAPVELGQAAGFLCGSANGYLINSTITFSEGNGRTKGQFFQYIGVDVVLMVCSSVFMGWMENSTVPVMVTKLITTVALGVLHYVIYKFLVFRIRKEDKP